jgi:hypothetical protein
MGSRPPAQVRERPFPRGIHGIPAPNNLSNSDTIRSAALPSHFSESEFARDQFPILTKIDIDLHFHSNQRS